MKICFVLNTLSTGGAERVASRLCSYWSNKHDVTILLTSYTTNREYDISDNIHLINLCEKKRVNRLKIIRLIKKQLKAIKPDVVVSFIDTGHFYTSLACKRLKIKHICSERNDPYNVPNKKLFRMMRRFAFKRCDAIVFQTEGAKQFFSKKIQLKGTIIENPITTDFNEKERKIDNVSNRIIAAGRLVEQKNYPLLIDSFSKFVHKHYEYVLDIYGRGPLEKELLELIKEKNVEKYVHINGFSKDILDEILKSKIYVLSSFHEGLPNSLMEAVCLGVPSIATDANPGGSKLILQNSKASILIDNNNIEQLYLALEKIHNDYQYYFDNAIKESYIFRERFSIDRIGEQWINLFTKLTNGKD